MTRTRVPLIAIAILAVAVCAGTGYAAFTASAYVNGTATAGTLGPLTWGSYSAHGYGVDIVCSDSTGETSLPLDTLYLTASNLVPGTFCGYAADIANHGSLPATVTEQITSASGGLCGALIYSDNAFTSGVPITSGAVGSLSFVVPGEGSLAWGATLYFPSPPPPGSLSGATCSFMVTLTGSAGS